MAARRSWPAEVAACGALGLPIVVAMAAHGGFFARGQLAFAAVGVGMALAVIALMQPPDGALRNPALLALGALAALSAVSAIWTIAPAEDALRWSAVIAALFLLGIASAAVATRIGALPLAATIALFAAGAGLVGLYGAGARVEPLAQRLGGQWSAGGPLEYSPALALLQVSALPALMLGMGGRGVRLAFASAMGIAIAGSILALSGSRVELALAVAVAAACAATAQRTLGLPVAKMAAAVALAATAGGAADAVAGSYVRAYVTGGDGPRLVGLAAIVLAAGGLWLLQRRALARARGRRGRALALGLILVPLGLLTDRRGTDPRFGTADRAGVRLYARPPLAMARRGRDGRGAAPGRVGLAVVLPGLPAPSGPATGPLRAQPSARNMGRARSGWRACRRSSLRRLGQARVDSAGLTRCLAARSSCARLPDREPLRLAVAHSRVRGGVRPRPGRIGRIVSRSVGRRSALAGY